MNPIKQFVKSNPILLKAVRSIRKKLYSSSDLRIYSIKDATNLTEQWCKMLPSSFDVVLGIPRSGLFIASIIAMKFQKPLATPEGFMKGEIWYCRSVPSAKLPEKVKRVLLVDDSVATGGRMKEYT